MGRTVLFGLSLLVCFVGNVALSGVAHAAVFVDARNVTGTQTGATWNTAFNSVQQGVDAAFASGGGEVWVAAGTYAESVSLKSGVRVYGGFAGSETALTQRDVDGNPTVLDGSTAGLAGGPVDHVVVMDSTTNARIDGFMIMGGVATTGYSLTGYGVVGVGGGVFCQFADETNTVAQCRIFGNQADAGGAGIFCRGASPLIANCHIDGNVAKKSYSFQTGGGGLCCVESSSPEVINSTIGANQGNHGGGVLCFDSSSPSLTNCVISGNRAQMAGGGVACGLNSSPIITNCTISSNSAPTGGGLTSGWYLFNQPSGNCDPVIVNTIFDTNSHYAIYERTTDSDPTVAYCLFSGNQYGDYFDEHMTGYTGAETIDANVVEASHNVSGAPAFLSEVSGTWVAAPVYDAGTNCTLLTASPDSFVADALVGALINTDVSQYRQAVVVANTASTLEVLGDVTAYTASGDTFNIINYTIDPSSACVDAGTDGSDIGVVIPGSDIHGKIRPYDCADIDNNGVLADYDIGASEYRPAEPPNQAPILNTIGNKTITAGQKLHFVLSATDSDADLLTCSAANLPAGASFNADTRTFSWTTASTSVGVYSNVQFSVSDNRTPPLSDSEAITITVKASTTGNNPPVMQPIGDKQVQPGAYVDFVVSASDPDPYDWVSYTVSNLPAGAKWWAGAHRVTWATTAANVGVYPNIVFTVTDHGTPALSVSQSITITVGQPNNAPVLAAVGNKQVNEGQSLQFTLAASDPDAGNTLTFDTSNVPAGAVFDTASGVFSWTPGYEAAGSYSVNFAVFDNGTPALSDTEAITITVANVNRAPSMNSVGAQQVNEGQLVQFAVSASDPDVGDALTFTATNLPGGAAFDAASGVFSWTPDYDAAGSYTVEFAVNDDGSPVLSDSLSVLLTVVDVNRAPALVTVGDKQGKEGQLLQFVVTASDPDTTDSLTFSAANLPAGATFDPATAVFSWTPKTGAAGTYTGIALAVADNGTPSLSDSEIITITVEALNANHPPVLNPIGNKTVQVGKYLDFIVTASDPDRYDALKYSVGNLPSGAKWWPGAHRVTWSPKAEDIGIHANIVFTATDNGSPRMSVSETISIEVTDGTAVTLNVDGAVKSASADGSHACPFRTISEALENAVDGRGDTIVVAPGIYTENVVLKTAVTLLSESGASDTHLVSATPDGSVVTMADGSALRGFTVTGTTGAAVSVSSDILAEVTHCVLHSSRIGLYVGERSLVECVNNVVYANEQGVFAETGAVFSTLKNNIFDSNGVAVIADVDSIVSGGHNVFNANGVDYEGPAAASTDFWADPLFVDIATSDFRLQAASPCRDAGDPDAVYADVDGSRNDIGACGGSYGVPESVIRVGDVNEDGSIDALDIQALINAALNRNAREYNCDVNGDGYVDALDIQSGINAALGL